MTQQLAFDAADDVGRELDSARGVAPVDSTDDRERGDLDEILVTLVRRADAPGELVSEGQVALDEAMPLCLAPSPCRRHPNHPKRLR
jgi:alkylhydroperoxidase family enzyme